MREYGNGKWEIGKLGNIHEYCAPASVAHSHSQRHYSLHSLALDSFIHLQQMSRHGFKYNKYCIVNFYCIHLFPSPIFLPLTHILID